MISVAWLLKIEMWFGGQPVQSFQVELSWWARHQWGVAC
jgi:hypothetical protein